MKRALLALIVGLVLVPSAVAGGPAMFVGAADDVVETQEPVFAKSEMDKARLAGLDTIRITAQWTTGTAALASIDQIALRSAVIAAKFDGLRVVLSLYPSGSKVTPLSDQDRGDFARWAADIARKFPGVRDFIVGNEPNLNRFWLPQFDPLDGHDVAAGAYQALLATTYDAIKAVAPKTTVYGGALAPRGVDKPNTGRDTHSPTTFIADLGAAYRASGREIPLMDAFAFHPYADNSSQAPSFAHPNSTSIGLADYDKLVGLLGQAFDGTAQRGSTLPILYDEFGVEATIPPAKSALYTGTEPATTHPVDETTQAQYYQQAVQMAFCQPNVIGLLLFHFQDEPALSGWQSGEFYVDGAPKASLFPVRDAAFASRRGVVATCAGMALTPKVALVAGKPRNGVLKLFLTCSLDCAYVVRLDRLPSHVPLGTLTGTAIGRLTTQLTFPGKPLAAGSYQATVQATARANAGPPGTGATSTITVRGAS